MMGMLYICDEKSTRGVVAYEPYSDLHAAAAHYTLTPVKALGLDAFYVFLEGVFALGAGFEA